MPGLQRIADKALREIQFPLLALDRKIYALHEQFMRAEVLT